MEPFSHLDDLGHPRMVDVGGKERTAREALAEEGFIASNYSDALFREPQIRRCNESCGSCRNNGCKKARNLSSVII